MKSESKIGSVSQVIEAQCRKCRYWHEDVIDEDGLEWAPFCDLFHGNGLAYPCEQFVPSSSQSSVNLEPSGEYRTSEVPPPLPSTPTPTCPECGSTRVRIVYKDDEATEVDFYDCTICSTVFHDSSMPSEIK